MNRLLLILSILLVLCFTTVIFALRGTNNYGDTINRDAMEEYRMTDHEDDDPFLYEWVQQSGNDSDGPVYSYSNVYAEMAYEQHFYTSASTTLGCNEDGVTGEYQASADVMGLVHNSDLLCAIIFLQPQLL